MSDEKKITSTTEEEVKVSVASLYSGLLSKRRQEKEEKEARKLQEKEERRREKEEQEANEPKMSKKERRQAELDSWKEVVIGLTGDDLEYSHEKKSKKKYRKWIDDDNPSSIMVDKPKKIKKKNYNKEFDPELSMLKALVADQNKFTADLQKRFQNAVGPATKDAMPLNKTMVELAAAINASRGNALGVLREIGSIKRTIADLYMKQKKLDADMGGSGNYDNTDLALVGSNIAASLLGDNSPMNQSVNLSPSGQSTYAPDYNNNTGSANGISTIFTGSPINPQPTGVLTASSIEEFDPNTWKGPDLPTNSSVLYETIPHSYVVEWNKSNETARFKAVRDDNGEELIGCPVPASDPSKLKFDEKNLTVRGEFDEIYALEIKE